MVDGLVNKRVLFIIQARMKSKRLPGKVLMKIPLLIGKPLIQWIVDTLKASKYNNSIIIATSTNSENDILERFCETVEVECFRGSENNVFSRFKSLVEKYHCDAVVRLTSDNPFIDIYLLDEVIQKHFQKQSDYTFSANLPLGMNVEVISPKAILSIDERKLSDSEKEHVTLFLRKSNDFKKEKISFNLKDYSNVRLTIDYPSDLLLITSLLTVCHETNSLPEMKLLDLFLEEVPEIFEVNSHNKQTKT